MARPRPRTDVLNVSGSRATSPDTRRRSAPPARVWLEDRPLAGSYVGASSRDQALADDPAMAVTAVTTAARYADQQRHRRAGRTKPESGPPLPRWGRTRPGRARLAVPRPSSRVTPTAPPRKRLHRHAQRPRPPFFLVAHGDRTSKTFPARPAHTGRAGSTGDGDVGDRPALPHDARPPAAETAGLRPRLRPSC